MCVSAVVQRGRKVNMGERVGVPEVCENTSKSFISPKRKPLCRCYRIERRCKQGVRRYSATRGVGHSVKMFAREQIIKWCNMVPASKRGSTFNTFNTVAIILADCRLNGTLVHLRGGCAGAQHRDTTTGKSECFNKEITSGQRFALCK